MSFLSTASYPSVQITGLLNLWGKGESEALDRLYPLVFDDLRRMASQNLRKERYSLLQPTALVNEVFLKLLNRRSLRWKNRAQFFGFVAREMRRILVDHARKRKTLRRGRDWTMVALDEAVTVAARRDLDLLALDDALNDLARIDRELCQVVELSFFVGLSQEEIAHALDTSRSAVQRQLQAARAWLYRELAQSAGSRASEASGDRVSPRIEESSGGGGESGEGPCRGGDGSGGGDDGSELPPPSQGPPSRYLHGRLPSRVRLGQTVGLQVRIGIEAGDEKSRRLRDFEIATEGSEILFVLHCPGFELQNDHCQRLTVLPNQDSDWAIFELQAIAEGAHGVEVSAFDRGRYLGALELDVRVVEGHSTQSSRDHYAEIQQGRGSPGSYTLLVRHDAVREAYVYRLIAPDHGVTEETYSDLFQRKPAAAIRGYLEQVRHRFGSGSTLNRAQTHHWLRCLGRSLWDELVPRVLRSEFWNHRDHIRQILVVSKDDLVPWELLCPYRAGSRDDGEFLADLFPIGRWRHGSWPPDRLNLAAGVLVQPAGSLLQARREIEEIGRLLDSRGTDVQGPIGELGELQKVLEARRFNLLHFACHQSFNSTFPPGSTIRMGNQDFEPLYLKAHSGRFVDNRPLVFLNACESDGKAPVATEIGGWANAFLDAGVGAFIGTLWEVSDRSAKEFAIEFYQELLDSESRAKNLGEALQAARAATRDRPGDPTWLAYTLYGDPSARWVEPSIPQGSGRRE